MELCSLEQSRLRSGCTAPCSSLRRGSKERYWALRLEPMAGWEQLKAAETRTCHCSSLCCPGTTWSSHRPVSELLRGGCTTKPDMSATRASGITAAYLTAAHTSCFPCPPPAFSCFFSCPSHCFITRYF